MRSTLYGEFHASIHRLGVMYMSITHYVHISEGPCRLRVCGVLACSGCIYTGLEIFMASLVPSVHDVRIDGARRDSFRQAWGGRGFMVPSEFLLYKVTLTSVYIHVCSRLLGGRGK